MGDAPERIWAYREWMGNWAEGTWTDIDPGGTDIEYLRADIAAAREAELRAEVERLTRALESAVETVEQSAIKRGVAEAEVERLKSEASGWRTVAESNGVMAQSHSAEAARLRALLKDAREALEPFGSYLDSHPFDRDFYNNPKPDDHGCGWVYLNAGQFRRASATLAKIGGQHD